MKKVFAVTVLAACLVAHESRAGEWVWLIGGEETCTNCLTDRVAGSSSTAMEQVWIEGFLSGSNWALSQSYGRGNSSEDLWHYVNAYRRVHPREHQPGGGTPDECAFEAPMKRVRQASRGWSQTLASPFCTPDVRRARGGLGLFGSPYGCGGRATTRAV
jgi:hypothetical protein